MVFISLVVGYGLITHFETISSPMNNLVKIIIFSLWDFPSEADIFFINFLTIVYPTFFMALALVVYFSPNTTAESRIRIIQLVFLGFVYFPYSVYISFSSLNNIYKNKILRWINKLFLFFMVLVIASIFLCVWIVFYFSLSIFLPWEIALGSILFLAGLLFYNIRIGGRKDREARNPLHGILDS